MAEPKYDVYVQREGTLFLFRVLSDAAQEWIDEHVSAEAWSWMGNGLAVEPRYAVDLAQGMLDAGLRLV